MKTNFFLIVFFIFAFISCKRAGIEKLIDEKLNAESPNDLYFNYSVDGKNFDVDEQDILTTYNQFSADAR